MAPGHHVTKGTASYRHKYELAVFQAQNDVLFIISDGERIHCRSQIQRALDLQAEKKEKTIQENVFFSCP